MRMSLYQLHRCVWDELRAGEVSCGKGPDFDVERYDLTEQERAAYDQGDVAELYRLGLHPVLLNGYCRARGLSRDDYRGVLEAFATNGSQARKPRWLR
jgi:hypothetical protein